MALKALVTKDRANEIKEEYKSLYAENQNGDFVLEVDGALDVFAPGLVTKNKELIGKLKLSNEQKEQLEAKYADIDLEKYQQLLKAAEDESNKGGENGDAAKALAAFEQKEKLWGNEKTKLSNSIESLTKERDAVNAKYHSTLVSNEILSAITVLKGNPEMLLPAILLAGKVKVCVEDGKDTVRIVDNDGVVLVGDTQGTPMTTKQYVETEFKSKSNWAGAFEADPKGGSGSQPSVRTKSGIDLSKLSPTERLKHAHRA